MSRNLKCRVVSKEWFFIKAQQKKVKKLFQFPNSHVAAAASERISLIFLFCLCDCVHDTWRSFIHNKRVVRVIITKIVVIFSVKFHMWKGFFLSILTRLYVCLDFHFWWKASKYRSSSKNTPNAYLSHDDEP